MESQPADASAFLPTNGGGGEPLAIGSGLPGHAPHAGVPPRMDVFPTSDGSPDRWRFGVFDFDGRTLELSKNGRSVAIRPQPLKVLALLLAARGELVSRDDLQ